MSQEWTVEETETLIRLLEKVKADNGWWPTEECMRVAHATMSAWAPELVITKFNGIGRNIPKNILLARYEGGVMEFHGMWHIPGGYGTIADRSIEAACSRIAQRELGMDVDFIRAFERPYLWCTSEHPYGQPLSLYCIVSPQRTIQETESLRFFGANELPDKIVEPHRRFIQQFIFP